MLAREADLQKSRFADDISSDEFRIQSLSKCSDRDVQSLKIVIHSDPESTSARSGCRGRGKGALRTVER